MDFTWLTDTSRSFVRLPGIQASARRERQQIMYAIRILSEAMWRLFWEAFDIWVADKDMESWISSTEHM